MSLELSLDIQPTWCYFEISTSIIKLAWTSTKYLDKSPLRKVGFCAPSTWFNFSDKKANSSLFTILIVWTLNSNLYLLRHSKAVDILYMCIYILLQQLSWEDQCIDLSHEERERERGMILLDIKKINQWQPCSLNMLYLDGACKKL